MNFSQYTWFKKNNQTLQVIQEFDDLNFTPGDVIYRMDRSCHSVPDIHVFIQYVELSDMSNRIKHYIVNDIEEVYHIVQEHLYLDPRVVLYGCNLTPIRV